MNYASIIESALQKKISPERPIGCCRVYVSIADKVHVPDVKKAAKKLGLTFQANGHYGTRNAIYVGYDNMDGLALARGAVLAGDLKAAGVECYREEHGD